MPWAGDIARAAAVAMNEDWTPGFDPCWTCRGGAMVRRAKPVPCCDGERVELRCTACGDEWATESHPRHCSQLKWTMPDLGEGEFLMTWADQP